MHGHDARVGRNIGVPRFALPSASLPHVHAAANAPWLAANARRAGDLRSDPPGPGAPIEAS